MNQTATKYFDTSCELDIPAKYNFGNAETCHCRFTPLGPHCFWAKCISLFQYHHCWWKHETGKSNWGSGDVGLVLCNVLWALGLAGSWCLPGMCQAVLPPCYPSSPWFTQVATLAGSGLVSLSFRTLFLWRGVLVSLMQAHPLCTHSVSPCLAIVLGFCSPDSFKDTEQVPHTSVLNCSLALATGSALWVVQTQSILFWKICYDFIDSVLNEIGFYGRFLSASLCAISRIGVCIALLLGNFLSCGPCSLKSFLVSASGSSSVLCIIRLDVSTDILDSFKN